MALVTKTDPKGVDFVINAIQNYIYPNLLGEGWDVYQCYPRANKNFKGNFIIPELSIDPNEYKEVLFDDKVKASSFFLVDDRVAFNEDEQLIVQNVSIIFQLNIAELFPGVTDHRADEEVHVLLTQLFTDNQDLFVDVLGYETGIRNVYRDLNIAGIGFNTELNDDMSKFHVVKYNFTVTYDLQDCDFTFSPTCSPASISINAENFVVVSSGASENIEVVDQNGDPNGAAGTGPLAGKWVVTPTASATLKYNLPQPFVQNEENTYDEGWHNTNGTYSNPIGTGDKVVTLDPTDWYKISDDIGALGNNYRFWGLNNIGYYNSDDGTYRLANGNLSDRQTIFDDDDYAFDRLTGLAWRTRRGGTTTIPTALNSAAGATWNGFDNWFLPIRTHIESILDLELTNPLDDAESPIFSIDPLTYKTATPYAGDPSLRGHQYQSSTSFVSNRNYSTADAILYVRKAF